MDYSLPGSSVHGDSPGKNTGVGCHFLLQGIFPTQGLNLHLLHWQVGSLLLSHQDIFVVKVNNNIHLSKYKVSGTELLKINSDY